jgi:hypothetical protein
MLQGKTPMSDEPRKPEREVHFYVPAHLEPPQLDGFTALETNRVIQALRQNGVGEPDPASKLERVLGGRLRCELEPVKLKRRASVAELVSAAFSNGARHLILKDPGVRLGDDPEALHDARSGC